MLPAKNACYLSLSDPGLGCLYIYKNQIIWCEISHIEYLLKTENFEKF